MKPVGTIFGLVCLVVASHAVAQTGRPNVVLLIGDDVGFSDLSPFGSDIDTPNIARLASEGISFTNYHTPPACSPSRGQLHTGLDHHRIGLGRWDYAPYPGRDGLPGYEGYLTQDHVSVAELMREAGYHTFIAGKWHQGHESHTDPVHHGFEESYVLLEGGANNYNNLGMLSDYPIANFTRNGRKIQRPEGTHSDEFWTDELIGMIDAHRDGSPFYAVLGFQTVHFPLQAPEDYIAKYQERLEPGWETQRMDRLSLQKELGILSPDYEFPASGRPPQQRWTELSEADRAFETKRGAVYAAMIEHHDYYIGQLIEYLESIDEYENTLIIYVSDNGGALTDFRHGLPGPRGQSWFDEHFDHSLENIGTASSNIGPGINWGTASNVPSSRHKLTVNEGGIRVPMLIRTPDSSEAGAYSDALAQPMDIAATVLAAASVEHPGDIYNGRAVHPLQGRSLLPVLHGELDSVYAGDEVIVIELLGNTAVLMGDWKLTRMRSGMGGNNLWQLFNLKTDPQESRDLSEQNPQIHADMQSRYQRYADELGFVPVDDDWPARPAMD